MSTATLDYRPTPAGSRSETAQITLTLSLPAGVSGRTASEAARILSAYAEHLIPGASARTSVPPTPLRPTSRTTPAQAPSAHRGSVSPLAPARRDAALRLASQRARTAHSPVSANPGTWQSASSPASPAYRGDGLLIDLNDRSVTIDGERVEFTFKEFELLAYLTRNPKRTVCREELMETVWAEAEAETGERTVDVHIRRVRTKLARFRRVVTTARGVGYRFDPSSEVFLAGR